MCVTTLDLGLVIKNVANDFKMDHIMTQLKEAMMNGSKVVIFERCNDVPIQSALPTGKMHLMQAVVLRKAGWTVGESERTFTVSGWW